MSNVPELLRVGTGFALSAVDPAGTPGLPEKKTVRKDPKTWAREQLVDLGAQLATQQEMLFATAKADPKDKRRLLLVLQAMDCGGKDGTVKKVAGTMNPQGLHIVGFGPPTATELRHDFLWRIHRALPKPGLVGVFNRSHYEDVLVVRVRKLAPKRVWLSRYPQINDFEQELADAGVTLVKVMLHISFEEQQRRLLERLRDPTKFWKYSPADVDNRAYWPAYQEAYHDALAHCSTDLAPWYVVPADRKWYRDWAVAHLMLHAFKGMNLQYPPANFDPQRERQRIEEGVSQT
ncbi:polyphosphate kinase [Rhizocola hellebori]|uniref:Polyphosphate kinase n=1 Tax=Rhizocola hellebori TaxID=1392758 RepID=A0A8J3VL53_9ACTN|nr:PPK2 family polyphosphate kinase [Rhizocola hellebori]GIH10257.1 polyphosphate kinase [Rhizocola hellebori]